MYARELHHFKEKQISAGLRAVVEKALTVPTTDRSALRMTRTLLSKSLDGSAGSKTSFQERIGNAVSRSAADVSVRAPEKGQVRDAANLIVSAALHYLEDPGAKPAPGDPGQLRRGHRRRPRLDPGLTRTALPPPKE
ncbi:hypothetical protein [Streptomyces sp. NPDC059788]|uniref:hypothetical protein n=1 Tax=Streptomyces sp. NPDC059788 TaxID=3346948 RepID=UPI003653986F